MIKTSRYALPQDKTMLKQKKKIHFPLVTLYRERSNKMNLLSVLTQLIVSIEESLVIPSSSVDSEKCEHFSLYILHFFQSHQITFSKF